jgi:hypothetical protein
MRFLHSSHTFNAATAGSVNWKVPGAGLLAAVQMTHWVRPPGLPSGAACQPPVTLMWRDTAGRW